MKKNLNSKTIAVSGMVMAMYVIVMYFTQSFAFGMYQIRIATSLYALCYPLPFLVIPLGIANSLSNLLGGLGLLDIIGGLIVGLVTGGAVYAIRRFRLPSVLVIPVIILGPGLIVPLWLSPILNIPYLALVISLCAGQVLPGVFGYVLIKVLARLGFERKMRIESDE
jgi:hypothetical protein